MLSRAEFRGGLLALGGLTAVVYLLISFSPGLPGEMLLQSLRFHIALGGIGLSALLALAGARWRGLLLLLVTLASLAEGAQLVAEQQRRRAVAEAPLRELSVLSYNVLTSNARAEEAARHIAALAPDVAVIMETPGIEPYLEDIAAALPHRVGCAETANCDLAILSRHPIVSGEVLPMWPFRFQRLVRAVLDVEGTPVTVVGVHLSKPYFDGASWSEALQVGRLLARQEGPVIVAGDFNAAAWSETLVWLGRHAELAPPPWYPASWPVRLGPLGVPIDNMFTRGNARILAIEAGAESYGSNHRYLLGTVGIYAAP